MKANTNDRLALAVVGCLLSLGLASPIWGACPLGLALQGQQAAPAPAAAGAEATPQQPVELTLEQHGDLSMARKAYADAADYYRRALKQIRDADAALWNKVGIAQQQRANYREARKAYNQAIRRRKDFAEPLNNMGTTYFLTDNHKKAIKYYRKAIALNPNSAAFHLNLGSAYYRRKKFQDAVEEFRTALMLDPNALTSDSRTGVVVKARDGDVEYYFYMAKVFASLGRVEEAVRYLRRAFEDGFKDRKRVEEDPDFQKISESAAFIELMKNPPGPLK